MGSPSDAGTVREQESQPDVAFAPDTPDNRSFEDDTLAEHWEHFAQSSKKLWKGLQAIVRAQVTYCGPLRTSFLSVIICAICSVCASFPGVRGSLKQFFESRDWILVSLITILYLFILYHLVLMSKSVTESILFRVRPGSMLRKLYLSNEARRAADPFMWERATSSDDLTLRVNSVLNNLVPRFRRMQRSYVLKWALHALAIGCLMITVIYAVALSPWQGYESPIKDLSSGPTPVIYYVATGLVTGGDQSVIGGSIGYYVGTSIALIAIAVIVLGGAFLVSSCHLLPDSLRADVELRLWPDKGAEPATQGLPSTVLAMVPEGIGGPTAEPNG